MAKCCWILVIGHYCKADATITMKYNGEQYANLCGAHGAEAKRLWPAYEYVERRQAKKNLTAVCE